MMTKAYTCLLIHLSAINVSAPYEDGPAYGHVACHHNQRSRKFASSRFSFVGKKPSVGVEILAAGSSSPARTVLL